MAESFPVFGKELEEKMSSWSPPTMEVFLGYNNRPTVRSLILEASLGTKHFDVDILTYVIKPYHWYYKSNDGTREKFLPSLRLLFLECEDPTEYEFAHKYFGNNIMWQRLKDSNWFKPHYEEWIKELDARLRSKAFRFLKQEASDEGSKNFFQANKLIFAEGANTLKASQKKGVGRPNKPKDNTHELLLSEIENELKQQEEEGQVVTFVPKF